VNYLIDTNVISEVRNCDPYVSAWFSSIKDEDVYLSVLVLGEIPQGNVAGLGADVLNPFEPSITPR
jgi:predicted nucleic acid-binding protein